MAEIVAQFAEGAHWCVSYRLWQLIDTEDGPVVQSVEPIVRIPVEVWLRHDEPGRAQLVETGVAFSRLHYPELMEERPDGGDRADRGPDAGADGPAKRDRQPDAGPAARRAGQPRR